MPPPRLTPGFESHPSRGLIKSEAPGGRGAAESQRAVFFFPAPAPLLRRLSFNSEIERYQWPKSSFFLTSSFCGRRWLDLDPFGEGEGGLREAQGTLGLCAGPPPSLPVPLPPASHTASEGHSPQLLLSGSEGSEPAAPAAVLLPLGDNDDDEPLSPHVIADRVPPPRRCLTQNAYLIFS